MRIRILGIVGPHLEFNLGLLVVCYRLLSLRRHDDGHDDDDNGLIYAHGLGWTSMLFFWWTMMMTGSSPFFGWWSSSLGEVGIRTIF